MVITKSIEQEKTVLKLEGRLDAITSTDLQEEILQYFHEGRHLILDFQGVNYVSSAGLRSLLIGQKTAASKGGSMVLRQVGEVVMDVLAVTGFSGILTIE